MIAAGRDLLPTPLLPARTESARAPRRRFELVDLAQLHSRKGSDEKLGDAIAASKRDSVGAVIDQQDLDFPAIAAVDQAGTVHDADAVTSGVTGAGQDEPGEAVRNRDRKTGWHRGAFAGSELDVGGGGQIEPRIAGVGLRWRR